MPVEIKELVIKTTVHQKEVKKEGEADAGQKSSAPASVDGKTLGKLKESILNECMNMINDHLSNINER